MAQTSLARRSEEEEFPVTPRLGSLARLLSLPMLAFFILPLLALILGTTPAQVLQNLKLPQVQQAITLSLVTTLVATLVTVLVGTPLAFALAHRAFRFQRLVDTIIDMPLVLPPAVAGVALLMAFGRRGLLGGALTSFGLHIAFTPLAVILAQIFIAAPFYIKAASLGFASVNRELEQAAGLDGANNWQIFRYVVAPLSWSALLSGSVMTWARALGEFGATIIFAGNFPGRTQTMPLAVYIGFELDLEIALTLSVLLMLLSFLALMIVKGILHRELP
jgi:molybdate transport system permease protein